ncbi:aldolase [Chromohalobacter japonicus]|uniref:Aldolase n=1 Tax=Chromohalobacter japonicus TaxID=223900 RepID=A0A1Q8TFC9_9GAMM|nr:aldolase/citrate lyase family protein [Chromohalobacter japonicus]OLO12374.1 aldolase [Chromohalobacter japonicus]
MENNNCDYIVKNTAKQLLDNGSLAVGMGVRQGRTADTAKVAKACGFDWLFIDMEHNSMDVDNAVQMCVAALDTGVTPIVRVPSHHHFHATRLLDGGAMGIIFPHIDTPDQAREAVLNCRFPPIGNRSIPGGLPQLGFAALPQSESCDIFNQNLLVIVMLETEEAISNADDIAAIDGVDILLIGSSDLAASMHIPGDFYHPKIEAAYDNVISACRKHKKHPGMGGIYDNKVMEKYVMKGARFLLGGSDLSFIISAGSNRRAFLDSLL